MLYSYCCGKPGQYVILTPQQALLSGEDTTRRKTIRRPRGVIANGMNLPVEQGSEIVNVKHLASERSVASSTFSVDGSHANLHAATPEGYGGSRSAEAHLARTSRGPRFCLGRPPAGRVSPAGLRPIDCAVPAVTLKTQALYWESQTSAACFGWPRAGRYRPLSSWAGLFRFPCHICWTRTQLIASHLTGLCDQLATPIYLCTCPCSTPIGQYVVWRRHKFATRTVTNRGIQRQTAVYAVMRIPLFLLQNLVPEIGIEPTTYALRMRRSTN